ncbi:MAG TPA: heme-binding protein [Candidatus Dormibacteraeota bacterium]|nr:heme-binding protein [Candidatus Dormibacteraeota bacterium]
MAALSLDKVYQVIDAGLASARELKVAACIAIVDASGYLMMKVRMDGATFITVQLSEDKAYTAAAINMATHEFQDLVQPSQELYGLVPDATGRLVPLPGGLPLRLNDRLVGAVGVSGGSVQQDLQIAEAVAHSLGHGLEPSRP